MRFANHYIFAMDKNQNLIIKAYNWELVSLICYDFMRKRYKLTIKTSDTQFARDVLRDF